MGLAALGGSAGGGGGGSGRVSYPTYVEALHEYWLKGTNTTIVGGIAEVIDASMTAADGNPYANAYVHDPNVDLDDVRSRYDEFNTNLGKFDEIGNWEKIIGAANDAIESTVLSESKIEAVVAQFKTDQRAVHEQSVSHFNASQADMNAVTSSAFVVGRSLLLEEFNRTISGFRANLTLQNQKQKFLFIMQSAERMASLLTARISFDQSSTHLLGEINRVKSVLLTEHVEADLDLSLKDATWDLNLYQYGGNIMAAPGGGVLVPSAQQQPSRARSAVGGALSGAGMGAYVGGAVSGGEAGDTDYSALGAGIGAALGIGSAFL